MQWFVRWFMHLSKKRVIPGLILGGLIKPRWGCFRKEVKLKNCSKSNVKLPVLVSLCE